MAIASVDRNHGTQYPLVATQEFTVAQLASGEAVGAIKLPYGARVIGGGVLITTAFNSTTSDKLDVGDGGDPDRYTSSEITISSTGYTALTISGYKYTQTDYVDLTWTGVGADAGAADADEGAGVLIVMYVIDGRANEVNPDYD